MSETIFRQCTLCEAHCGIRVEVADGRVRRITGDPDDVLSRGYICPKAAALVDVAEDPDRLRAPVKRVGSEFVEIGWDEALELAASGLRRVRSAHGRDALATYLGNPSAHGSGALAALLLRRRLGGRNHYSATSADQLPQYLSSLEMFGHFAVFPVPDLDRTSYMMILGANPAVSNGSLLTAPGVRDRLRGVRARGGRVVVVDPRRTETAQLASEHVAVAPGGDAYLLLGMLHEVFAHGLTRLDRLRIEVEGLARLRELVAAWPPERAAPLAGVPAEQISRLAVEFAGASPAVAYGRVGVCQTQTGALTHWLINALNIVTGNLDLPGGAMFPRPPVDVIGLLERVGGKAHWGNYTQRVSGLPEFMDEVPVAGLADEILVPGEGQVRGMLLIAGNPVLSTPGGSRLEAAMETLEWCVAVDMYITETTRHAHVILPPVAQLERSDVDVVFPALSVRNHIRYNRAALPAPPDGHTDWQILMGLLARMGKGMVGGAVDGVLRLLGPMALQSPEPLIDLALRSGPYGMLRSPSRRLDMGKVRKSEHGIDLGGLEPNLRSMLRTPGRRVRLAPAVMVEEVGRLVELADERASAVRKGYDLVLIGRRNLRSNNSWMHNSPRLMKGGDRCTALMHPDDALARGVVAGGRARVSSRVGSIELPVEISDEMRPGVISIPHGFGHGRPGVGWQVAAAHPGVSVNDITDPSMVDRLTGNAAFNATMVRVGPVDAGAEPAAGEAAGAPAVV